MILFLLIGLFSLWVGFLSLTRAALAVLGEAFIVENKPRSLCYLPLHAALFKNHPFDLLLYSCSMSSHLARLAYGGLSILAIMGMATTFLSLGFLLFLLILILFLGDFLPRFLALRAPERTAKFTLPVTGFFLYLSLPLTGVLLLFANREKKSVRSDSIEEMKEAIAEILLKSEVKGTLDFSDKKLLTSVLEFKDRIVREVMIPRVDLFCLPVTISIREAASQLIPEGFSRIPVYRESLDNIVGILMFKDILEIYMECESGKKDSSVLESSIETVVKSVFYVPETKKVSHLLLDFRAKQVHMAIVVDEYGGTEGVVTLEDILEEIVGEIADEYDVSEETLFTVQPGSGSWVVDARMTIFDAEDTFGIDIPQEGDYDTIGGYIYHKAGALPPKGFQISGDSFDLEVLSSSERSVEKVRVTPKRHKQDV